MFLLQENPGNILVRWPPPHGIGKRPITWFLYYIYNHSFIYIEDKMPKAGNKENIDPDITFDTGPSNRRKKDRRGIKRELMRMKGGSD